MISWSYYGAQGVVYLVRQRGVFVCKLAYCALIVLAYMGRLKRGELARSESAKRGNGAS